MPYLVKTAVDSVLVLSWVEVTTEAPPVAQAIPLGEGRFLLDERSLPPGTREALEAQGAVTSRYLLVPWGDPARELAARYPAAFRETPAGYAAPEEALKGIPPGDLLRLRGGALRLLGFLALAYLGFLLLRFGLAYGQVYTLQYAGQRIMFDLRGAIFRHLLRLPMGFLDGQPTGRLVTRATNDVAAINDLFTQGLVSLVQDFLMMAGVLGIMFHLHPRLALGMLAFAPRCLG